VISDEGLYTVKDSKLVSADLEKPAPEALVQDPIFPSDSSLWLTTNQGACCYDNLAREHYDKVDGLLGENIYALTAGPS
jgi:hypothetical protein